MLNINVIEFYWDFNGGLLFFFINYVGLIKQYSGEGDTYWANVC